MPASDHNRTEDQFAEHMPAAGETVVDAGQADADADAAVGGNDFEDDVEDRIVDGIGLELARLGDGDEEDREDDPPEIVGELAAELLADEVAAGLGGDACGLVSVGCKAPFQVSEVGVFRMGSGGGVEGWVVGVDAEGALLVDVGVAHGDDYGVDGDVHHEDVENEEADAELGDVDDIEAAGADCEGLEEAIEDAEVGWDAVEGVIADLKMGRLVGVMMKEGSGRRA